MGIRDTLSMVNEARKAQNQMKKNKVAGQDGDEVVSIMMNGVYEVLEMKVDVGRLLKKSLGIDVDENGDSEEEINIKYKDLLKIVKTVEDKSKDAMNDTRKQLEKKLANSANIEDLKRMMGM